MSGQEFLFEPKEIEQFIKLLVRLFPSELSRWDIVQMTPAKDKSVHSVIDRLRDNKDIVPYPYSRGRGVLWILRENVW